MESVLIGINRRFFTMKFFNNKNAYFFTIFVLKAKIRYVFTMQFFNNDLKKI